MKHIKKAKNFSKEYFPVIVWLEEMEEIYAALKREGGNVSVSTENYEFESIADAAQHFGQRPQYDLKISASSPYASIEFTRLWTRVYVGSSPTSATVFYELDEVLTRSQRKPPFLYSYWLIWPVIIINNIPLVWTSLPSNSSWSTVLIVPVLVWYLWIGFVRLRQSSVIRFQRRSESRPFWDRNRDQLMMMLLSAIVGGLITILGSKLKDQYFPPSSPPSTRQ